MALYDGSGTLTGSSSSSLTGAVIHYAQIVASGTSSVSAVFERTINETALLSGSSFTELAITVDAPLTTLAGASSSALAGVKIISSGTLHFDGFGTISLTETLPTEGSSSTSIFGEVVKTNLFAKKCPPKTFKWMQLFQRGDLALFLQDGKLVPSDVSLIFFALYQVKGQSRVPRGPQRRTPAKGALGEYYVTGLAGESGQPGDWIIVWTYQAEPGDPLVNVEYPFKVVDSVVSEVSNSLLVRKRKYGWD